jgi:hypothetical protein
MPIGLVIRLAYSRPDICHQLIMMCLTIVESAIRLSEGIGLLPSGNQISFWRQPADNKSIDFAAGIITTGFFGHVSPLPLLTFQSSDSSSGLIMTRGTFASID